MRIDECFGSEDVGGKFGDLNTFLQLAEDEVLPEGFIVEEVVSRDAESRPDELGVLILCHFAENLRDAAEDVVVLLGNKFPEIEQREFHLLVVNLAVSVVLAKAARFLEHLFVEDTEPGKVNVVLHNSVLYGSYCWFWF